LVLVGANGAGKTTLLRSIAGLLHPKTGTVEVFGKPLRSYRRKELAARVAYVPQVDGRSAPFTVEQFVLLGRYPHLRPLSGPTACDLKAVQRALELTGTVHLRDRRLEALSGGEAQKVFIAACLAQEAPCLLLDEPTTFLDYRHQVEILRLLSDLNCSEGVTVIAATHDLGCALQVSQRALALHSGRIVFDGPAEELAREELLQEIYETAFCVVRHPVTGKPVPLPGGGGL